MSSKTIILPFRIPQMRQLIQRATFSSTSIVQAGPGPVLGLQDLLNSVNAPGQSDRTPANLPSRPPSSPLQGDSSNPALLNIPSPSPLPASSRPSGISNKSWQDVDRPLTPRFSGPSPSNASQPPQPSVGGESRSLFSALRKGTDALQAGRVINANVRQRELQASRTWRDGDVYAPHDLSYVEMQKAKIARQGRPAIVAENTRRKGGRDVLDDLGIDPLKEYKNFALMGEFMTETGKIRHSRDTGLRAVNQRRMAKAVRRAVGMGIMPSVHRHPELHEERIALRRRMGG